jgi:polyphosphate kinase 2 (PPK2 family)
MKRKKVSAKKAPAEKQEPMGRKEYEKELERLHGELVRLQEWVKKKGSCREPDYSYKYVKRVF